MSDHDDTDAPTEDAGAWQEGRLVRLQIDGEVVASFTSENAKALAHDLIYAALEIDLDSEVPAGPVHLPRRRVTPPDVEHN